MANTTSRSIALVVVAYKRKSTSYRFTSLTCHLIPSLRNLMLAAGLGLVAFIRCDLAARDAANIALFVDEIQPRYRLLAAFGASNGPQLFRCGEHLLNRLFRRHAV